MNCSFAMFLTVEFENWINQCEGAIVAEIPRCRKRRVCQWTLGRGKRPKWLGKGTMISPPNQSLPVTLEDLFNEEKRELLDDGIRLIEDPC